MPRELKKINTFEAIDCRILPVEPNIQRNNLHDLQTDFTKAKRRIAHGR